MDLGERYREKARQSFAATYIPALGASNWERGEVAVFLNGADAMLAEPPWEPPAFFTGDAQESALVVRLLMILRAALFVVLCVSFAAAAKKPKAKPCKRTAFSRHTTNYQAWREQMTVCDLLQDYDAAVRPSGRTPYNDSKGAVMVTTSLDIRSISAVSEKNMEFVAQFRFRQEWYDDRLRFIEHQGLLSPDYRNFEYIHVARDQRLWIPDTFFQNERNGWYHMLDQENRFLKIRSDGKLIYDRRLTLILACSMHLSRYPMDHQNCEIAFASYAYTTADIEYIWDTPPIILHEGANGALPNFEIAKLINGSCTSTTNTGTYSCLKVQIRLNRVFSFFLLQLYIPSTMLVGVAWVSYWIDWKSTAARVPLAIITLLSMITTSHAINSNLPPVSYAKSIDIWVGACVVFIFFSLIEYAVVNYMGILDEHRQMRKAACNRSRLSNVMDNDVFEATSPQSVTFSPQEKKRLLRRRQKKSFELREDGGDFEAFEMAERRPPRTAGVVEEGWTFHDTTDLVYIGQRKRVELVRWCSVLSSRGRAERIDIIARIIFPIAFMLFNFAYWSIYLEEQPSPRDIQWSKDPTQMKQETVKTLIGKFSMGLPILDHPYRFVVETGIMDLVLAVRESSTIVPVLPQLTRGIRAALYSFDSEKKKFCLRLLSRVTAMEEVGPALVPYYRQLLPPLSKSSRMARVFFSETIRQARNDRSHKSQNEKARQLEELVQATLNDLERTGGPSATINLKYMMPSYESCLHGLL
ncbi:unnamed protein product [Caenorhabditis auriculariae]|uniref:Uncharacterized protein n=1 Tax=Caenorhabditis auriculariae TaxID=2777116 RepID=A0A8S1H9B8_9PELO|nr:unnamed protein product [Caenorhabditis auriculariae]